MRDDGVGSGVGLRNGEDVREFVGWCVDTIPSSLIDGVGVRAFIFKS